MSMCITLEKLVAELMQPKRTSQKHVRTKEEMLEAPWKLIPQLLRVLYNRHTNLLIESDKESVRNRQDARTNIDAR